MVFVFLFLTYFIQYDNLQDYPCYCKWHYFVIFIYVPQLLYPFICQRTFPLFSCIGCCEQCCYERRDACIFLNYSFVWIYAQEWGCQIKWQLYFWFFEEPPDCFPQYLHQFTVPPRTQDCFLFSTSSPTFVICTFLNDGHSDQCEVVLHCSSGLHFSDSQ